MAFTFQYSFSSSTVAKVSSSGEWSDSAMTEVLLYHINHFQILIFGCRLDGHLWSVKYVINVWQRQHTAQMFAPIIRIERNISLKMSVKADEGEVYDESCYPGSATESEDDIDLKSADQTSLTIDDSLPPSDVSCSVCSDILIDPVSLHCGHTFCQLCLAQVWRSSGKVDPGRLSCPVCRLPWRNFPGINITLRYDSLGVSHCQDVMNCVCLCVFVFVWWSRIVCQFSYE